MVNSIITAFQLFGIGLTLGLSSQCFFMCAPLALSYVTAIETDWKRALGAVMLLAMGRLLAYVLLGALVGISSGYIDKLASSTAVIMLRLIAGGIIILLGLLIVFGTGPKDEACAHIRRSRLSGSGLFLTGLTIGLAPCFPLASVMFEISVISKSALAGACYALFFGLGTVLATAITVGPLAGLMGHIPSKTLKSGRIRAFFRTVCGILLVAFGIVLMLSPRL